MKNPSEVLQKKLKEQTLVVVNIYQRLFSTACQDYNEPSNSKTT